MSLDKLYKKIVAGVLVVEYIEDKKIIADRLEVCNGCDKRDAEKNKCTICKCYLDVKTESKVNRNSELMKSEITHCPLNKWADHFSKYGYDISKRKS